MLKRKVSTGIHLSVLQKVMHSMIGCLTLANLLFITMDRPLNV